MPDTTPAAAASDTEDEGTRPGRRRLEYLPIDEITPARRNAKRHNRDGIVGSIHTFDFTDPCIVDERTGRLVAGHGRIDALRWMRDANYPPPDGIDTDGPDWLAPVVRGWSSRDDAHAHAAGIAINRHTELGGWDSDTLGSMLDEIRAVEPDLLDHVGISDEQLADMMRDLDEPDTPDGDGENTNNVEGAAAGADDAGPRPTLADRFLIPPFDVLDARQGWWRDRKRAWLNYGIRSGEGRNGWTYDTDGNVSGAGLTFTDRSVTDPAFYSKKRQVEARLGYTMSSSEFQRSEHYEPPDNGGISGSGTSVFDPVLCELAYRWFCPPDGTVVDPFAGGSVRGLVAALLGRRYRGNDLDTDQIKANQAQADMLADTGALDRDHVTWTAGDSATWAPTLAPESADLLFTCPPYLWLEQYDPDDPDDLSNLDAAGFETAFTTILTSTAAALRRDRYAVLVVGDVRDSNGRLHDLRGMTIRAAETAGLTFQSGAVLVTPSGSAAVRAGRPFDATRSLTRTHQDVLVFYKGNASRAADACGDVTTHLPDHLADAFNGTGPAVAGGDYTPDTTPIEHHDGIWVKRDDLWIYRGASGAKARAMIHAAEEIQAAGILSAGARQSPQLERAALAAKALNIPARLHTGAGRDTDETRTAEAAGADLQRHKPARLTVIKARYDSDADNPDYAGWLQVPFGMEHPTYLDEVADQAEALPVGAYERIVVPTDSGMTLAAVLTGLERAANLAPVLAIQVGADPTSRLDAHAPQGWRDRITLTPSDLAYDDRADNHLGELRLDPIYEAKCLPHLRAGDLLWCVGARASIHP